MPKKQGMLMRQRATMFQPPSNIVKLESGQPVTDALIAQVIAIEKELLKLEDVEEAGGDSELRWDMVMVADNVLFQQYLNLYQEVQVHRKALKADIVARFLKDYDIAPNNLRIDWHYMLDLYLAQDDSLAIEYASLMSLQERMEKFIESFQI